MLSLAFALSISLAQSQGITSQEIPTEEIPFTHPWPTFRGPGRSGIAEDFVLGDDFDLDRDRLWSRSLDPGHSSPIVAHDVVYVTVARERRVHLAAFDVASGALRFEVPGPEPERWPEGRAPREVHPAELFAVSTPAADEWGVYVSYPDRGVVAYSFDGVERWRAPFEPHDAPYPGTASPIVADGKLIHLCDHDGASFIAALDVVTGELVWRTERPHAQHGFSSPTVAEGCVVVSGARCVDVYELATGESRWRHDGTAWQARATPIVSGGVAFVQSAVESMQELGERVVTEPWDEACGRWDRDADGRLSLAELAQAAIPGGFDLHDLDRDDHINRDEWSLLAARTASASGLFALELGGTGPGRLVWHRRPRIPHYATPVLAGQTLLLFRDGGFVTALAPATGDERWTTRIDGLHGKALPSPIAVRDGVLLLDADGGLAQVDPTDGSVKGVWHLGERVHATPAVAHGVLLVRTASKLHAFRGRERHTTTALIGVSILPMDGRGLLEDQTIVLDGGRVCALGPRRDTPVPESAEVIALPQRAIVVPGLVDAWTRLEDERELNAHLAAGVTALRVVDGRPAHIVWKREIEAGRRSGPRLLIGAAALAAGHAPEQARATVKSAHEQGFDFVHLDLDCSEHAARAALEMAELVETRVAGPWPPSLASAHPWTSEHLELYLGQAAPKVAAEARPLTPLLNSFETWFEAEHERRVWSERHHSISEVSPTARVLWGPRAHSFHRSLPVNLRQHFAQLVADAARALAAFSEAGARLIAGSHALTPFIGPGSGLHRELQRWTAAGLAPETCFEAATAGAGAALGGAFRDRIGVLVIGGPADLIVVECDPRADLSALSAPLGVMSYGRWYPRPMLELERERSRALYRAEVEFVLAITGKRAGGAEALREMLENGEIRVDGLREGTALRLCELLEHPTVQRVEEADVVRRFAHGRWPRSGVGPWR